MMDGTNSGAQKRQQRVIIFSGVFDPVHNGHISVAKNMLEHEAGLVVFLPERIPHRTLSSEDKVLRKIDCSSYQDRLAMVRLATAHEPRFKVLESPFDHHTIKETLHWIKDQFPAGQNFGLLFGADVASHFMQWPDVDQLQDYCVDEVIFANRVTDSIFELKDNQLGGANLKIIKAPNDHISSTKIRQDLSAQLGNLPPAVVNYLKLHHLYAK